jgi:hypothetical protein
MTPQQHTKFCTAFFPAFAFLLFLLLRPTNGFHSSFRPSATTTTFRRPSIIISSSSNPSCLYGLPKQNPGESDIDYIQRLTSMSIESLAAASTENSTNNNDNNNNNNNEQPPKKQKGGYKRIEEWDAERKTNGEMSWEERVQYEGQRHGNQVRQNDILQRNLHTW